MAQRFFFRSTPHEKHYVSEELCDFEFFSGFSISQKQKSIRSLHNQIKNKFSEKNILEISSKSENPLGNALSAFNLKMYIEELDRRVSIENIFQASKVFSCGGPFIDLMNCSASEAKKDQRLKNSGRMLNFQFSGQDWSLEPKTAFYDWLYINALKQNPNVANELCSYEIFTDIEFNHNKSINCQARSAALFVSLVKLGEIDKALSSKDSFTSYYQKPSTLKQMQIIDLDVF